MNLNGKDQFGSFLDNLLELPPQKLLFYLNLYALFSRRIIVSDSWSLTCWALQDLLAGRTASELVREGILVLALRDKFSTYREFVANEERNGFPIKQSRKPTNQQISLFDASKIIPFPGAKVGATYRKASDILENPADLIRLGVSQQSAELTSKIIREARARGEDTGTNTFLYDCVRPQLPDADANLIIGVNGTGVARAIYRTVLPATLGIGIATPSGLNDDSVLRVILGEQVETGTLLFDGSESDFQASIADPLLAWLLTPSTLENLAPEHLVMARGQESFTAFLQAREVFFLSPNTETWQSLILALEKYGKDAAHAIFESVKEEQGRYIDETDVVETSGKAEKITLESTASSAHPLELSGLKARESDTLILGKVLPLPIVSK